MSINIIINGAEGRMGSLAIEHLSKNSTFNIVASIGRKDDLAGAITEHKPDIVLELTNSDCVFENTKIIIEHKARPVVGASGLTAEQISSLQQLAEQNNIGGIIAPNFCIGGVLMMRFAAEAAKHYAHAEIVEMHHPGKLDSPSGTATATAHRIKESMNQKKEADIPIHSVRLPGIIAKQQVIFGGHSETLTIEHNTSHRDAFMPGIALACEKAMHFNQLVVGLEYCL
jgi:4-hydroxy-tetrahydrodipicolinate reductase